MRLARPFIFICGRTYVTYVWPVALSARHVFFIVGHPVGRGSKLSAALLQGACLRPTRSDEKLPELFAKRVLQSLRQPRLELASGL